MSYGSNQSNAMYSLCVLAKMKNWKFIYFCDHIPSFLEKNPTGNYKYALMNGMKIISSKNRLEDANLLEDDKTIIIQEGGRQKEAEYGLKKLANELLEEIKKNAIEKPYIFLPSGTGTTALFLQKYLPFKVYTCNTVGNDTYLKEQWDMLNVEVENYPIILNSISKLMKYGKI